MSRNSKKKRRTEKARRKAWTKRQVPRSGTEPKDAECRQHLLYENEANVALVLEQAARHGERNPVVFVIDARDDLGYAIAVARLGEEKVRSHITEVSRSGAIPTTTLAIPHADAVGLLKTLKCSPVAMPKFSEVPPDGWAWVVVVAAGGNLFVMVKSPPKGCEYAEDAGTETERLLKLGQSESLQVTFGTGKSSFRGLLEKEHFDPFVTSPPFLSTSEQEYRRAVKKAMAAESERRGGRFRPSPQYRTREEFLDSMLQIYEQAVAIGWMGKVPPVDTARIIIESLAGSK